MLREIYDIFTTLQEIYGKVSLKFPVTWAQILSHYLKQECIPVGCVPPAAVAISPAMHAPLPHRACSPATHAPPVDRQTPVKTLPSQK